jgi:NitT/TauT family transport system substrate-binding protein
VFLVADTGFNPYATVVIARRDLVRQKPEMVSAFVAAMAEGWRAYLADPKPTNELIAHLNPAMNAQVLEAAAEAQRPLIETDVSKHEGIGAMRPERWETLAKQLLDLKMVDSQAPASELFVSVGAK